MYQFLGVAQGCESSLSKSRSLNPATVEPVLTSFAPNIRCAKPCLLPIGRTIQPGGIMAPMSNNFNNPLPDEFWLGEGEI